MRPTSGGLIRPHSSKLALVHRLLDGGLIFLALEASRVFLEVDQANVYPLAGAWSVLVFLTIGNARNLYGSWRLESLRTQMGNVVTVWSMTAGAMVLAAFATRTSWYFSRLVVGVWFVLAPVLLILLRIGIRRVLSAYRISGHNTRTVAILGMTQTGFQVAEKVRSAPWLGLRVVGFFDDRAEVRDPMDSAKDEPRLGSFQDLLQAAKSGSIDYVYITLPMRAEQRIRDMVGQLADTTASVYLIPNFFVVNLLQGRWSSLDGIPLLSFYESPFYSVDGWVKRLEDLILGGIILLLVAIPMVFIAIGVKLTSPGPVLFKQRRYGLNGKVVEVWKFRSMSVCEDGGAVVQARKGDSRVTPFGAFLRHTSLDELPQFINVLQGTMSIVGPRPHAVVHNEEYRKLIHGYMLRHKVKPGITGWAQINGWRGETDTLEKMSERIKFDLEYMREWSLLMDLKIIVLTIFKGFVSTKAY